MNRESPSVLRLSCEPSTEDESESESSGGEKGGLDDLRGRDEVCCVDNHLWERKEGRRRLKSEGGKKG